MPDKRPRETKALAICDVTTLPHEERDRQGIAANLSKQLAYCRNSLNSYIDILDPPVELRKEFPAIVIDMAASLHVRIARRYRQALYLAEAGQADGVEVICRTMYESFLALAFICRDEIELRHEGGGIVDLFGKDLTQQFRAYLFYAFTPLRREKQHNKMKAIASLKKFAEEQLGHLAPEVAAITNTIGEDWVRALKKKNTCAGISVADLSYSYGEDVYMWYLTLYGTHSSHIHAGSHDWYLTRDFDQTKAIVSWRDSDEDTARALLHSTAILGLATTEFARLLDPNDERYIRARLFESTYDELKQVFIDSYRDDRRT